MHFNAGHIDILRKGNLEWKQWLVMTHLSSREAQALPGDVQVHFLMPVSCSQPAAGWHRASLAAWSSGRAAGEELSSLAWPCGDCGVKGRGTFFLPGGVRSGTVGKGECHLLLSTRTNISHQVRGAVFWAAGSRTRNQTAFPNSLKFVTVSCFSLVNVFFVKPLANSCWGAWRKWKGD